MDAVYKSHMGSDLSVCDAARVSFDKLASMFTEKQNASLIHYLARGCSTDDWTSLAERFMQDGISTDDIKELMLYVKKIPEHWVPFAHTAITLRMKAPVPIRTQCFKHKTGMVESEESRRYIKSRPEIFIPNSFRAAPLGSIKQGSADDHPRSNEWLSIYGSATAAMVDLYEDMIADGVCPEQARLALPQGCEVNWVWTGNLYSFANFFIKRSDSHAQKEIRDLAYAVEKIVQPLFPISWPALTSGSL